MTLSEYENLQDLFRSSLKLNHFNYSGNKEEAYQNGIKVCMSILRNEYKTIKKEKEK